jgi:hypothetical protein
LGEAPASLVADLEELPPVCYLSVERHRAVLLHPTYTRGRAEFNEFDGDCRDVNARWDSSLCCSPSGAERWMKRKREHQTPAVRRWRASREWFASIRGVHAASEGPDRVRGARAGGGCTTVISVNDMNAALRDSPGPPSSSTEKLPTGAFLQAKASRTQLGSDTARVATPPLAKFSCPRHGLLHELAEEENQRVGRREQIALPGSWMQHTGRRERPWWVWQKDMDGDDAEPTCLR